MLSSDSFSTTSFSINSFSFGELESLARAFILSTQSIQQRLSDPQQIKSIISDRAELPALVIYAAHTIAQRLQTQQFIQSINAKQAAILRELLAQQGILSHINDIQALAALVETAAVMASAHQSEVDLQQSIQASAVINSTTTNTGTLS